MSDKIVIVGYANTLLKLDGFDLPSALTDGDSSLE